MVDAILAALENGGTVALALLEAVAIGFLWRDLKCTRREHIRTLERLAQERTDQANQLHGFTSVIDALTQAIRGN